MVIPPLLKFPQFQAFFITVVNYGTFTLFFSVMWIRLPVFCNADLDPDPDHGSTSASL